MDTSETYIKMCDCPELQEQWRVACGDYCLITKPDNRIVIVVEGNLEIRTSASNFVTVTFPESYGRNTDLKKLDNLIWLPRQDQLQEMVGLELLEDTHLVIWKTLWNTSLKMEITKKDKVTRKQQYWYYVEGESMEQLWLTFVMKEKYNKIWSVKEWE